MKDAATQNAPSVQFGTNPTEVAQPMTPKLAGVELSDFSGLVQRRPWMVRAACRGMKIGIFVTGRGEPTGEAKATCRRCQVRSECLAYALADPDMVGVWGGTSARERDRMRRGAVA
jgi:WhiB family redox-sensing transcriptional regulator